MIYTDGVHLISDTSNAELHSFAQGIGMRRNWFQDLPGRPHYDLMGAMKKRAIDAGAKLAERDEFLQALYRNPAYVEWKDGLKR